MKYNAVIFDLDGTLLNTLEDLNDSVNFALDSGGFKRNTVKQTRLYAGNGIRVLMQRSLPESSDGETLEKYLEIFRTHYQKNMTNKTRAYDGIYEALKALRENGVKLGVVSNKFDLAVKDLCGKYFGEYIKVAIGEDEKNGIRKKPAPDSVLRAMEILGSDAEHTLYIGDSETDVETAHNAGLKCIGVLWGFRDEEILKKAGADYIIKKPEEIINRL